MLNISITLVCALVFLLSGSLIQCIKRIFQIIIEIFLKLLNFLGIKINKHEGSVKASKEFKEAFPDIKIVKKSKKNVKIKSSINWVCLTLFLISLTLIIMNLNVVSNNMVSHWLYDLHFGDTRVANLILIGSQKDMDIAFTAAIFSIISFTASKLLSQWKETAKFRQARKEIKLKQNAISLMTSKELLDESKNKNIEQYKALKKEDQ